MPYIMVAAAISLAFAGYRAAGLWGVLTGLAVAITCVSGTAIAFATKEANLAPSRKAQALQRVGGLISVCAVLVGAIWLGWKWGWIGAIIGYLIGMMATTLIYFLFGRIRGNEDRAASAGSLPQAELGTVPVVSPEDFLARTLGGRPNNMDMTAYDGAEFSCACGHSHAYRNGEVRVLRELSGMRLVLTCPTSDSLTCVHVRGLMEFDGFESLFGSQGASKSPS